MLPVTRTSVGASTLPYHPSADAPMAPPGRPNRPDRSPQVAPEQCPRPCRVPPQNRCPEAGRGSCQWSCEERLRSTSSKPIFPVARLIPVSRISDGLIEAGGCPDRSGLRRSSVILVNQATQQVPASDRVVDGERRDVFRSLRRNKVEPAMGVVRGCNARRMSPIPSGDGVRPGGTLDWGTRCGPSG
jgi:hypothetical protein